MMESRFNLQEYLSREIEGLVAHVAKATLKNPRESAFLLKFAVAAAAASKKRREAEARGLHIPSFLIASVTSQCNLHCAGCYSRCTRATVDDEPVKQLSGGEWLEVFGEADELGISFILLAGGEPLLRRDVMEGAGRRPNVLFPIFTNGTLLDEPYFELFDKCRNLVPILSIEGGKESTDARRGPGIHDRLLQAMDELHRRNLAFGASVTVTMRNLREVVSGEFLDKLSGRGCKAVVFVEYVPVTDESRELAPGDAERDYLQAQLARLRDDHPEMVCVSFPGDEKSLGGCLAAGRGFFHINSRGGAEPCPFSPHSDANVRELGVLGALNSPLFQALRDGGVLDGGHVGGCVLHERRAMVEKLLGNLSGTKPGQTPGEMA